MPNAIFGQDTRKIKSSRCLQAANTTMEVQQMWSLVKALCAEVAHMCTKHNSM